MIFWLSISLAISSTILMIRTLDDEDQFHFWLKVNITCLVVSIFAPVT